MRCAAGGRGRRENATRQKARTNPSFLPYCARDPFREARISTSTICLTVTSVPPGGRGLWERERRGLEHPSERSNVRTNSRSVHFRYVFLLRVSKASWQVSRPVAVADYKQRRQNEGVLYENRYRSSISINDPPKRCRLVAGRLGATIGRAPGATWTSRSGQARKARSSATAPSRSTASGPTPEPGAPSRRVATASSPELAGRRQELLELFG